MKKRMHRNSLTAYASLRLARRERQVLLAIHRSRKPLNDSTIAVLMGSQDPNTARPVCTRLVQRGILMENGTEYHNGRPRRLLSICGRA